MPNMVPVRVRATKYDPAPLLCELYKRDGIIHLDCYIRGKHYDLTVDELLEEILSAEEQWDKKNEKKDDPKD